MSFIFDHIYIYIYIHTRQRRKSAGWRQREWVLRRWRWTRSVCQCSTARRQSRPVPLHALHMHRRSTSQVSIPPIGHTWLYDQTVFSVRQLLPTHGALERARGLQNTARTTPKRCTVGDLLATTPPGNGNNKVPIASHHDNPHTAHRAARVSYSFAIKVKVKVTWLYIAPLSLLAPKALRHGSHSLPVNNTMPASTS